MTGDQWLGAELAGYRIDALLGHGGTGVVYRPLTCACDDRRR